MSHKNAVRLLEACEKGLCDLLAKAAAKGDYSEVIQLTSWARIINGLAQDAHTERASGGFSPSTKDVSLRSTPVETATRRASRKAVQRISAPKPEGYPKFFRSGDDLVKIGWSKREGQEYQHKAPYKVLSLLIRKLAVVGAGGRMFTADDVLPLTTDHGSEIPNYQGYLCLAWLRGEGLIQSHGRQGYTVQNGEGLNKSMEDRWQALGT